jgi:uncharacterized protein
MSDGKLQKTRRAFLKKMGAIGAGSIFSSVVPMTHASDEKGAGGNPSATVPTRPFGKTGEDVSILSLGGVLNMSDQIVFRQAFKLGVTYWDTADNYGWGKNEKAIGKYFAKFPDDRKKVFLVTKAATSDPRELSEKLDRSLRRMHTSHVDMFFIHYVSDVNDELTPEVKAWAERKKAEGRIRFFGFSAHKNMENSMLAAAKLGWIDGIMMSYNYRLMVKDGMKRAVDACAAAGIGLTAMKTQAAFSANLYAAIGSETDGALKMTERFLKKGFTAEQAKLIAVWENPQIASICSAMPNMTILKANATAAMSGIKLSSRHRRVLDRYARQTASGYCAGCARICESAVNPRVPVSDILRYAMYNCSYGDRERALSLFRAIPSDIRSGILMADYVSAEQKCPQKVPIGKLVKQAYEDLNPFDISKIRAY